MSFLRWIIVFAIVAAISVGIVLWPAFTPSPPPANDQPRESEPISVQMSPEAQEVIDELQDLQGRLEQVKAGMNALDFLRRAKGHAEKYVETGDQIELDLAKQATGIAFKAACAYEDPQTMVKVVEWMKEFRAKVEMWSRIPQSQPRVPAPPEDGNLWKKPDAQTQDD